MKTDRELMQQALGYMESVGQMDMYPEEWAIVVALRERLAQELEPVLQEIEQYRMQMAGISTAAIGYWKEGDDIHPDYDTIALRDVARLYAKYDALYKAQPEQEPVGKFAQFTDGIWREVTDGSAGVPLYTTPPQRKPMTDGELADLWYKQSLDWLEFARAIEAAHGIGEKPDAA